MPSVATVAPPLLPEFVALSPAPTQTPLGLAGQIGQLARILTGGLVGGQRQPIAVPPDLISALVLPGAAVPGAQAVSGPMEPMGQGFAFPDVSQYSFGLGRVTAPQVGTPVVPRAPATGFSGFVEGLGTSVRGFLGTPISQFFGGGTSAAAQARQLQSMDAFATFDEMGTAMPSQTPGFQSMTRFGEFGEITPSVSAAGAGSGFDLTAALQSLTVGQGLGLALSSVTFGVGLYSAYQSGSPLAGTITGGLSGAALGGQLAATGLVPVASSTAGAIGAGVGAAAGLALALAGRAKTKQEKRTAINRTRRMGAYATGAARLVRRLAQGLDEAVDRANEEVQNAAKNATLAKPVAVLDEYLRTHVVGDLGDPGYTMTNGWKTFGGTMKGITGEIQYGQAIAFKDPLPKGWGIRPGGRVIDPDPRFDVILHEADLGAGTPPTEFWGYADAGDVVTVLAEYVRVRERFQEMQDRLDLEAAGDRLTAAAEAADEHVAAMAKLAYGQPRAAAIFFESLRGGQVAGLPLGGVIRKLAQLNLAGRFGQDWPVDAELQGLADDERLGPAVDVPDSFIAADNLGRLRSIVEGARRGREQLDEADADLRAQFQEIGEKAPIAYDERSTVGGVTRRTYLPFQARPGGPADDVYEAPRGQQFLVSGQQLGSLGLTDDQVSDLIKHIREVAGRRGMVMDLGSDDFMMTGLG
jgi:hypothetical protein